MNGMVDSLPFMPSHLPIALVEDDPGFRRAVARFLRVSGHQVRTFASAEEFLESPQESYGCLILDFQLPGISGLELFQRISATGQNRRAIFISAREAGGIREKVSELSGCAFLRKPFEANELKEAVLIQLHQDPGSTHSNRMMD